MIRRFIAEQAALLGVAADPADDMILALNELVTNSLMHGYGGSPGPVEIAIWSEHADLLVRLRDYAPPFDPNSAPEPDINRVPSRSRPGGLGIYLTHKIVDGLVYHRTGDGANEILLRKRDAIM